VGVLFYSGSQEPEMLIEALACGALGLALKAGPPEELLDAIAAVARGDTWLDPRLTRLLRPRIHDDRSERLSAREYEVLCLLAEGMSGEAIARQLFLSPETIRTHVRNAMRKLGARTRSHAIAMIVSGRHGPAGGRPPQPVRLASAEPVAGRWGTTREGG
jgi:DNA-binding NarL/FixJ family response regulator